MTKTWNVGTNAVFCADFENMKVGDKCWILKTTDSSLVVLTKNDKNMPKDRHLKEISIPLESAGGFIKCTVGKPRKDFVSIRITTDDVEKMLAEKASS